MNPLVTPEIREVMETVHYWPSVSIIIPFEPKMSLKTELNRALKMAAAKVERELEGNYPEEMGRLVLQKLKALLKNLNFSTHKKSIAIYVSPVFEKVLYLDIAVEEKIIVDESFEIRDLVYCKKQLHKYLVLQLSGKESRIYLGNSSTFVRIVSNTPETVQAYSKDHREKVANFTDKSTEQEIVLHRFLQQIDKSLDHILNAYPLPLFVLGTKRILGHFKQLTKHERSVIDYIHGNYEDGTIQELKEILEPHVADWKKVMQKDLVNKLEEAAGKLKLVTGIKDVWKEAMNHKGRLLVVEKNYMYAAQHSESKNSIDSVTKSYNRFSYIKDAVDDIIEKVLENGGDIEFVDEGVLENYNHTALIKFY
ncbi:MAG: hypothetical protein ACKVOW_20255 [Chitinophagaceae bacterium]